MKVIGVIPARYGSTRFPGKALALLHGRPLILHVVDQVRRAKSLNQMMVATDDERIASVVRESGCEVAMTSSDCPTGSDRIAEAIRGGDWEIVVNIQGDEPAIDPGVIDATVKALLAASDCGVSTAMVPIRNQDDFLSPHVVKVVCNKSGRALYFSRSPLPSPARLAPGAFRAPGFIWGMKHLGLYAYRTTVLVDFIRWPQSPLEKRECLEQLRLLENGVAIRVVEVEHDSIGVDTPEELEQLNRMLAAAK